MRARLGEQRDAVPRWNSFVSGSHPEGDKRGPKPRAPPEDHVAKSGPHPQAHLEAGGSQENSSSRKAS